MTISAKDIKFPSLCISRDQTFEIAKNDIELGICSKRAFKNGYFEGMKIFDSDGHSYVVEHANIMNYLPLYWGWKFLFMPRMVKAELSINRQKDVSVNEFKRIVNTLIELPGAVVSDVLITRELKNASTPKNIIAALSKLQIRGVPGTHYLSIVNLNCSTTPPGPDRPSPTGMTIWTGWYPGPSGVPGTHYLSIVN